MYCAELGTYLPCLLTAQYVLQQGLIRRSVRRCSCQQRIQTSLQGIQAAQRIEYHMLRVEYHKVAYGEDVCVTTWTSTNVLGYTPM